MTYPQSILDKRAALVASLKRDIANSKRRGAYAKSRDDWDKYHAERRTQDELYARLDVAESPTFLHRTALRTAYLECLRTDGMAIWQEMVQYLGITPREFDYNYTELLHAGLCTIEHHEFAYLAYGDGYKGRREYQLVTLRFVDPMKQAKA